MKRFARQFVFGFVISLAGFLAHAQQDSIFKAGDVVVITSPNTVIYTGPDESAKSKAIVQPGRRLKAAGSEENGFVPLATKSGHAFLRTSDVKLELPPPVLDEAPAPPEHRRTAHPVSLNADGEPRFPFGIKRITFDLGGSFGSVNGNSYSEFSLGANTFFTDWFAWRNAIFGRFSQYFGNVYGLDSSLRGIYDVRSGDYGLTVFAGPGYRFATSNQSAPFVEAGVVFHLSGFSIGGGAKSIFNSWVMSNTPNDTQYFIILAGGGSL